MAYTTNNNNTRIGRRLFLSLLVVLLATAVVAKNVRAKAFLSGGSRVRSHSFRLGIQQQQQRSLHEGERLSEGTFERESGRKDSESGDYVPYEKGTIVRFDHPDGTWMGGVVLDYNGSTQTYTIQWDEDEINEDFSDLKKVETMVNAAKQQGAAAAAADSALGTQEDEQEGFDLSYTPYSYEDLSDYDPWPVGTEALLEFADGWFWGEITSFRMSTDKKNATYVVTWSDGASDQFSNELEWMDLMVANAEDYEPWEMGTPAYGYPNTDRGEGQDSFLTGEITTWKKGVYSITWSNGDVKPYYDFDLVDSFVTNAANHIDPSWVNSYEPWEKGTVVTWNFDDGWWQGTINDFSRGTYTVIWSDGSTKDYSNLDKIDQMVAFSNGGGYQGNLGPPPQYDDVYAEDNDDAYASYYALQTVVYAEFKDGWWAGYIDSYEGEYYVIRWSDDSVDKFLPGGDMDEMVINGQNVPADYGIWDVGTRVHKDFDGQWYWGTIEYSNGGFYTIAWDDGSETTYVSGPEIDEMVNNAYKGNFFGKIAVALVVLSCVGLIAFYVTNRERKRFAAFTNAQVRESELGFSEEDDRHAGYSDGQPEGELPRIL